MAKEVNKSNKDKKEKSENKNKKNFFKEFKAELKRVSWPTFKQVVNNTTAVITIVLVVCAIVFVLDVIFENLNTFGVEKLKALVTSSSSENVEVNVNESENKAVEGAQDSNEAESQDANANTTAETVENVTTTTNEEATTEQ